MNRFKKVQSFFLVLVMVLSLFSGMGVAVYADTTEDYTGQTATGNYTISTGAQLAELARQVNLGTTYEGSTFTLEADIDLSQSDATTGNALTWTGGAEWTPIAPYTDEAGTQTGKCFNGTFDGNKHYINNIKINKLTASYEGYSLFGVVGTNSAIGVKGTVENLGVTGSVSSYRCAAGIAGYNYGTVSSCFSKVAVNANGGGGLRGSGGIVGHNEGTVEYCINAGTVSNAYRRAGGIVGYNYGGSARIDHCYNVGTVSSAADGYAGAIAATNGENATTAGIVTDSYYLTGSAVAVIGLDRSSSSDTAAFNANAMLLDGSGSPSATSLISCIERLGSDRFQRG